MSNDSDRNDYSEMPGVTEVHAAIQREHKDPSADVTPVPLWVTLLCGVAVCWAGTYIGAFHGGFSGNVYNEYESSPATLFPLPEQAGGKSAVIAVEDPIALGKSVFAGNCQSCHQPSGLGQPGTIPPLAGSEWVNGSEKRVAMIVLKGLIGPVKVKGATFNGVMVPWEATLSEKKIAAVLSYVRQEWGNKAGSISVAQIAAAKKEFAARKTSWAEADLLQVPEDAVLEGAEPAKADAPKGETPAPAAGAPAPAAATPAPAGAFDLAASIQRGTALYAQTCVVCHQPTGQGLPATFPPLAATEYTTGDARRMVAIVLKGINPPLTVKDAVYPAPMLAPEMTFPILKDDSKVADVVNYVRNSFGNKDAHGVTPEFVSAVRKEFADHAAPWVEADLKNFPPAK